MSENKIRNMAEFATLSGLSRPTVSKYFHDPSSVRAKTREQIEAALERYDWPAPVGWSGFSLSA